MSRYARDVAALARKDLLLELRARDTLPAMLLFVVAALVIFHFALPADSGDVAAKGLLWVAIVFTALLGLGRAFVAEREQGMLDALVLTPCDRSAIWLGKALADVGIAAVGTLVAAMAVAGRARELLLPLLFLPLAIPAIAGGVGASVVDDPGRYLAFLALYDGVFALLAWASFEYVVVE